MYDSRPASVPGSISPAAFLKPGSHGYREERKKMNLMQIINYIEENHLEHDFNKFRNFRYFSSKEPIEVTLIAFYQERTKGEHYNEN